MAPPAGCGHARYETPRRPSLFHPYAVGGCVALDGAAASRWMERLRRAGWRLRVDREVVAVPEAEAFETARQATRTEGIFSGPSTGANLAAALRIARRLGPGHR